MKVRITCVDDELNMSGYRDGDIILVEDGRHLSSDDVTTYTTDNRVAMLDEDGDVCVPCYEENGEHTYEWLLKEDNDFEDITPQTKVRRR